MTSTDFLILLNKFIEGNCSPEEEELILKWYNDVGNKRRLHLPEEQVPLIEEKLLNRILSKIQEDKRAIQPRNNSQFLLYRVAAAVAFLAVIGTGIFFFNQKELIEPVKTTSVARADDLIHITNTDKSVRHVILKDGSEVTLQPKSEIRFPSVFNGKQREVYLTGEAFFEIKKAPEQPFIVFANQVVTKVLGTSFSIKAYQNEAEITVSVRTGKVSVYTQSDDSQKEISEETILTPNQQAIYDKERKHVFKQLVLEPQIILSKPTLFDMKYEEAPVIKIFQVLEENYGIDIVYDENILSGCSLTTLMNNEGLFERIKIICEAIGAEYEVNGTDIIIKSAGCPSNELENNQP